MLWVLLAAFICFMFHIAYKIDGWCGIRQLMACESIGAVLMTYIAIAIKLISKG